MLCGLPGLVWLCLYRLPVVYSRSLRYRIVCYIRLLFVARGCVLGLPFAVAVTLRSRCWFVTFCGLLPLLHTTLLLRSLPLCIGSAVVPFIYRYAFGWFGLGLPPLRLPFVVTLFVTGCSFGSYVAVAWLPFRLHVTLLFLLRSLVTFALRLVPRCCLRSVVVRLICCRSLLRLRWVLRLVRCSFAVVDLRLFCLCCRFVTVCCTIGLRCHTRLI